MDFLNLLNYGVSWNQLHRRPEISDCSYIKKSTIRIVVLTTPILLARQAIQLLQTIPTTEHKNLVLRHTFERFSK